MDKYCKELERLIVDVLLPVYIEHARLTGNKNALKEINSDLLNAVRKKRSIPVLLQKASYGK